MHVIVTGSNNREVAGRYELADRQGDADRRDYCSEPRPHGPRVSGGSRMSKSVSSGGPFAALAGAVHKVDELKRRAGRSDLTLTERLHAEQQAIGAEVVLDEVAKAIESSG